MAGELGMVFIVFFYICTFQIVFNVLKMNAAKNNNYRAVLSAGRVKR